MPPLIMFLISTKAGTREGFLVAFPWIFSLSFYLGGGGGLSHSTGEVEPGRLFGQSDQPTW